MSNHPDAIVFVAAGNSGNQGAGSVGTPAVCKSGVGVGASMNARASFDAIYGSSPVSYSQQSLASFSSRGPTADGRLKPEMTAVGMYVNYVLGSVHATDYAELVV
jgi:serine protease AprX